MSQYVPDSTVKLYRVEGLDTKTGRTLAFVNAAARDGWMNSQIWPSAQYGTSVNVQVVKKRFQTIRLKMSMMETGGNDTLQFCNYLSFINPSYGNKIYYCNITNYDYINNETVEISYAIDWWMTDMFTANIEACSILREGFTKGEFNTLKKNPYADVIKMRTGEPIACTSETEPLHKVVASNNCMASGSPGKYDGWNVMNQMSEVYANGSSYYWGGGAVDSTTQPESKPFYIISFVGQKDGENVNWAVVQNAFQVLDDYIGGSSQPPYLKMTPELFPAPSGGGASMTYYAEARHESGATVSYSATPCHDIKYARPYYVLGTEDITTLQKITEVFANFDDVASILSIYSMPLSILGEFISCAFDSPAGALLASKIQYLRVPYPNVYKQMKSVSFPEFNIGVHPKLYRFPFSYVSIDGINDTGHIELQFEKMGSYDPNAATPDTGYGCRLDSNGVPSYWVLRKFVSITASGIYVGVAPVDYEKRLDNLDPSLLHKSDLAHGVFYTDFPQVPYVTDAWAEFMGSQAKQMAISNTAQLRLAEENQYGELTAQKFINNPIGSFLSSLGGASSAAGGAMGANATTASIGASAASSAAAFFTGGMNASARDVELSNRMAEMENQTKLRTAAQGYLSNPQESNMLSENFANAKAAFVSQNYHAGSNGGIINLINGVESIGVNLNIHFRAPVYISQYNAFLNMYGMATQEFKKPAITYFIAHDENNLAAPQFSGDVNSGDSWSGSTPINHVFYTQTENAHVSGVCSESSQYIENMLNGGVQFIDTLTRPV